MGEKARTVSLRDMIGKENYGPPVFKYDPQNVNTERQLTSREIAARDEKDRKKKERQEQKLTPNNDFWDNYKHPLWQKKRLEIMQRDEFTCRSCGADSVTLNVHHASPYKKGMAPWQYDESDLITLCEKCHESITNDVNYCKAAIMHTCNNTASSEEMRGIIQQLEGMNPLNLSVIRKIIIECAKL